MAHKGFVLTALALCVLIVYLFVDAPPPLPEKSDESARVPIEQVFEIVEAENDIVRALWTRDIVGAGIKAGLKFDEDWRERDVDAGPLPALFLRETANSLEKNPVQLSLYLGSDFPINDANRFTGSQAVKFEELKKTATPQFFFAPDTQRYTAMFSDVALVKPCVTCHNEHKQSPKSDWRLNDIMGATTWAYPAESVSFEEMIRIIAALREGFADAYTAYVEKTKSFATPPPTGERWPADGFYIPSSDVFMAEAQRRLSTGTMEKILSLLQEKQTAKTARAMAYRLETQMAFWVK